MPKQFHIGTSGWSYKHWKEIFYPADVKEREYLKFYADHFDVSEINTSFYHLPKVQTVINWTAAVPKDFKFCPKLSKYITHYQKLLNSGESLQRFFEIFQPMQKKLGPILVQLPHFVKFNAGKTEDFFSLLRTSYKQYHFALEVRDESWFSEESLALMKKYKISLVISQSGGQFPFFEAVTAKDIYYRFHGPGAMYASSYTDDMLKKYAHQFAEWMAEGHRIWVFFNNDVGGYAFRNAKTLNDLLVKLAPTKK